MQIAEKIKKAPKTLKFCLIYVKIILPYITGKYPKEEKTMKNVLRILIALVLALSCVFACTSCALNDVIDKITGVFSGNGGGNGEGEGEGGGEGDKPSLPKPPSGTIDTSDDYRIRFVYSYTAKIINANDRTEYKKEVKTVESIYIKRENNGFTADVLAQIDQLSYHGFTFDKWYVEWDFDNQVGVAGTEYAFDATVIDKDITLYGSRGEIRADWLAGPSATYEIVEIYEDGTTSKMSDGAEGDGEATEEEEEKVITDVVLYIKGTGALFNFTNPNEIDVPWHNRASDITKLVVEEGITVIGANAFGNLTKLKNVELPNTVTVIGDSAFAGCTNAGFRKFVCPDSLVSIERNAFNNATGLREVVLNEGLKTIKDNAFYKANKIMSIVVPTSLESVGNAAFHPGAVGSTNNDHKLSKVYYNGFEESGWNSINVAMDNSWFKDIPTVYYYTEDESIGNDTTADVPYWHYAEVNGEVTNIPAQYCYSIKYFLASGSKLPFKTIYVPVQEKIVDGELQYTEDGILILEGVITKDVVDQQKNIVYHGYRFADFGGASEIYEGMIINDDREYKGRRGNILSEDGGIKWEFIGVPVLDEDGNPTYDKDNGKPILSTSTGTVRVYKDETTEDRIRADILANYTSEFTSEETALVLADVTAAVEAEIAAGTLVLEGETDYAKGEAKKAEIAARVAAQADAIAAIVAERLLAEDVQAAMQAELDARLAVAFKIWDFEHIEDTGVLWNGGTTSLNKIQSLIIEEGVEYIGRYAFNSLSGIKEVILPASLEELHTTAFEACSALVAVLYTGEIYDESGNENCIGISELEKMGVVSFRTKLYELATEATADDGRFWMNISDTQKVTWELDGGKITVGGSDELPDFASPEEAPWYGAKDRITSVDFVSNVYSIGENLFNGYTNVTEINLPIELRGLPKSTFENTAIINNTAAYDDGILLINGHLLKVDASKISGSRYETFYGIISIAGGAFEGVNISELVVAASIQYINEGAFPDADIKKIYSESGKATWEAASANAGFADDVKVYFFSATEPDWRLPEHYYYVAGGEYVTWGCEEHRWSAWQITTAPTCINKGVKTRVCRNDPNHVETLEIDATGVHVFEGDWQLLTEATCTEHAVLCRPCSTYGCDALEQKIDEDSALADHVWGEYTLDNDGLTETAKCENCEATNTRTKETEEE